MGWAVFYMFVILKIPVALALWVIWWAVRAEPEPTEDDRAGSGGDGGSPHPRRRPPRPPRRGANGGPRPSAPTRVRVRPAVPAHSARRAGG